MSHRVVITGAGTVNALGADLATTWEAMAAGRGAIGPLDIPEVERLSIRIGAQLRDFDPGAHFSARQVGLLDRFSQFALLASDQALAMAGLAAGTLPEPERTAVVIGTAGGGVGTWNDSFRAVYAEGRNRVHPFVVPRLMTNAAASQISMRHEITGPTYTVSTACAASNHAIGQAFQMVRAGMVDRALAGGSEAMLCFGGLKAWEGLRVMSPDGCRPFAADRNGMVMGEGAAVFVLERLEDARARGAKILAEIVGFAMNSDASDIVMPNVDGAAAAMGLALRDAGLAPRDVAYVNAHGTGTAANDRAECQAIRRVFGAAADDLLVSSTKAMHGHVIGGTGAIELLAVLLALDGGIVPPTINHDQPDPECDLDVVPNVARCARVGAALSNAFAFGGLNAVLALAAAP